MADDFVGFRRQSIAHGDLPLLPGESEDIKRDAVELLGSDWFTEPNSNFGWKTPEQVVEEGRAFLVRNKLRAIKFVGSA